MLMQMELALGLSFVAGMGLGYLFFWGLWKTVERISSVKNPFLWMFSSFLIRSATVLAGFYVLLQIQWQLLAVAVLGFISARVVVTRYAVKKGNPSKKEAN